MEVPNKLEPEVLACVVLLEEVPNKLSFGGAVVPGRVEDRCSAAPKPPVVPEACVLPKRDMFARMMSVEYTVTLQHDAIFKKLTFSLGVFTFCLS